MTYRATTLPDCDDLWLVCGHIKGTTIRRSPYPVTSASRIFVGNSGTRIAEVRSAFEAAGFHIVDPVQAKRQIGQWDSPAEGNEIEVRRPKKSYAP